MLRVLLNNQMLVMTLMSATLAGGVSAVYVSLSVTGVELGSTLQRFWIGAAAGLTTGLLLFVLLRLLIRALLANDSLAEERERQASSAEAAAENEEPPAVEDGGSDEDSRPLNELAEEMAREGAMAATEQTWGERAAARQQSERKLTAWTDSPLINGAYINKLISGNANIGWFEWVVTKYLSEPAARALNIGCGDGSLERHGIFINAAQHFDAFDVSQGAIDVANGRARDDGYEERVSYGVTDLNRHVLPEHHYDVVFASQSLHHIANLEHLFEQVAKSLRPSGLFIVNEFVGANQFQWSSSQMEVAQTLLDTIPERYRMGILNGELKENVERQTIEMMNIVDPTEAIRSEELMDKFAEFFTIVEQRDFGGTYLNLVLENIVGNFDEKQAEDRRIIEQLCAEEQRLLAEGNVASDFTVVVMRKK